MKRVVITGLGIISPIGSDAKSFSAALMEGKNGIGPITRFDTTDFKVKIAAEVKDFSPQDYGIDGPTSRRMDLYTQFAMAAAKQAVEDSAIVGTVENERFGVYVGSGIGGIATFVSEVGKLTTRGPSRVSPFFIPMMIGNIAAGTIAIEYKAEGPCLPITTACASGTHSIGEAFRAIKHGYADAIIAGGAEASITPVAVAGFTNCQALTLSEDVNEASLPFDMRRAGFVIGEGAGIVVLEEYEHAKARGAKIYAEVAGYGNSDDAHHITAPRPDALCASRAIKCALKEAGIESGEGLYINAHGTGTPLNDSSETLAIKEALSEAEAKKAMVSSTKSMMGHMLGAAGGAEAVVCALAIKNGQVPPTINYREVDPDCDLDYVPNTARKADVKAAISTSLGFGGHNACIALLRVEE